MALDRHTAERAGYVIGDTVRFAIEGPTLAKKLVGIVDTDDPRVTAGGTLALFDTKTAQRLFLQPGRFDELAIGSAPGTDNEKLTQAIGELLPTESITATSGARLADEQARQIAENTKGLTRILLVFAGIALFVGIFTIANTFTMLISQRTRETALLRAVGASRSQVVNAVLIEAALLGLASSAAGFPLGLGVATGMTPLLNMGGAGLPDGPLVISASALLWSLVVGVGVTVLSAWLPARKAARIAPVEALSTVDEAPPQRAMVLRNTLGSLLAGVGVLALLYISTRNDGTETNLMIAVLGSVLTLTGLIVLAPLLSRPLILLLGAVAARLFGVAGKLAGQNALRNPRRTAATASALVIGLALITGMNVAGGSTQTALKEAAVRGLTADYKVSYAGSGGGIDPALGRRVAGLPGVAESVPIATSALDVRGEWAMLTGADPQRLGKVSDLRFSSGSLTDLGPGKIALSDELADQTGLAKGDTFTGALGFGTAPKKTTLTVIGVYQHTRAFGDAVGTMDEVLAHVDGGKLDSIMVKTASAHGTSSLDQDIRQVLGNSPLLQVQNQEQLTKAQSGTIDEMLSMMYGLLGMTVVIGVLGVINTLAMSVFERTREIGLLRAIGLGIRGVMRMVCLESVVISLFGTILGIATGAFLAWTCGSLAGSSLPTYETELPWAQLCLYLLVGLAVGVLAAIWPARQATRLNLLQSIHAR